MVVEWRFLMVLKNHGDFDCFGVCFFLYYFSFFYSDKRFIVAGFFYGCDELTRKETLE